MRYLVAFLAVLAFAFMATNAQAVCPSDAIGPVTDYDLPDSGYSNSIIPANCPDVDWNWDFHRTDKSTQRTIVHAVISNTDVSQSIDSNEYLDEGNFNKNGSGEVRGSPIQAIMYLDATHRDCGHFTNMEFEYGTLKK